MCAANMESDLQREVRDACARGRLLHIVGGGSKNFYGRAVANENGREAAKLELSGHRGILAYDRSERVITVRAGTRLAELEAELAAGGQMLGFEPPHFTHNATIGGAIATGLAGPRRAHTGAARDFVLGVKLLNGQGEVLNFGGQVMKNVAGFDLSRLMAGAMGSLGVLLEISLRLTPLPAVCTSLVIEQNAGEAIAYMNRLAGRAEPVTAMTWLGGQTWLRIEGRAAAVRETKARLLHEGCRTQNDDGAGDELWHALREHKHGFFTHGRPLWRITVPPATPAIDFGTEQLLEWGGGQRWFVGDMPADDIRTRARAVGGVATLFRGGCHEDEVFMPPTGAVLALHHGLKRAFDPKRILNRGRLYRDL